MTLKHEYVHINGFLVVPLWLTSWSCMFSSSYTELLTDNCVTLVIAINYVNVHICYLSQFITSSIMWTPILCSCVYIRYRSKATSHSLIFISRAMSIFGSSCKYCPLYSILRSPRALDSSVSSTKIRYINFTG